MVFNDAHSLTPPRARRCRHRGVVRARGVRAGAGAPARARSAGGADPVDRTGGAGRPAREPVEIQPGQPLAMDAVRETIVHLMGMGRYLDVQVSAVADGDGVRVEIDLVPGRDVRRVVFTGDLGLPERTLRTAVEERFGASPPSSRAATSAEPSKSCWSTTATCGRRWTFVRRSRAGGRRHRRARDVRATGPSGRRVVQGRQPRRRARRPVARAGQARSVLRPRGDPAPPCRRHRVLAGEALLRSRGQGRSPPIRRRHGGGHRHHVHPRPLVTVSVKDNALTPSSSRVRPR